MNHEFNQHQFGMNHQVISDALNTFFSKNVLKQHQSQK
jgi:hypothetical protein